MLPSPYVRMLLCLYPCSSVLYKSPTLFLGVRLCHRERENQINTLVLKDINFTINIIELSYYRTIDTLNQSKKAPVVKKKADPQKASPSPSKGGDVPNPTYIRFKLYPIRTSPPKATLSRGRGAGGEAWAWGGFFCGTYPN